MENHRRTTDEEGEYYCKEWIPDIAGTYSGLLVIYGGGKTMWEDVERWKAISNGFAYDNMGINVAAMMIPDLQHIFSLHHHQIAGISRFRKHEYAQYLAKVHSNKLNDEVEYDWKLALRASTSGLMAVTLGKLLGYSKFILCGVPYDGSGYFYKPMINQTFGDKPRGDEVKWAKDKFGDSLKSMSGRTRDMFGEPTEEWIRR